MPSVLKPSGLSHINKIDALNHPSYMKFHRLFLLLGAITVANFGAQAQIPVGAGGAGPFDFAAAPASPGSFSTLAVGTSSATYEAVGPFDTQIMTTVASSVNVALGSSPTVPPSPNGVARYNTVLLRLQTHPTGVDYILLMATLQNNTGATIESFKLTYDYGMENAPATELIPGFRVFFSTTGAAGSWQLLSSLSGMTVSTPGANATISGISWAAGSPAYILWADDNSVPNLDQANTIDNLLISQVITGGGVVPLTCSLTAPANGAVVFTPGPVTLTASVFGTTPAIEVIFFSNGGEISRDSTAPYTAQLTGLTPGTYVLFAEAYNALEISDSAMVTITVRDEFINYPGGTISQNFDGMGTAGVEAPTGWYVGAALPATSYTVMPGDGSAGASAAVLGWNYGTSGSGNRALGTAPTGADRNIVGRLQNKTGSNITAFAFHYDGETWRNYTNAVAGVLTNFVSYDLGATWVATGFDFDQPTARVDPQGAVDGDAAANRTAGIGGTITPPAPIPPGGVIYIRWYDFNGAGVTDGGLAVDNFTFQGTGFSQAVLAVTITAPTAGQGVGANCTGQASVTTSAIASPGGANTITNISFKLDAGTATNDAVAPYSVTFSNVALGPHTIMATARDSSGASVSSTVNFTVTVNQPAVIAYTNVHSGANLGPTFLVGSSITNLFGVTDADGTIAMLEFLVNGSVLFATNINYGQMVVNDALAGVSTYMVRATDNCGNVSTQSKTITVTNPPVTLIVTNGSSWKYSNLGSQPANDGGGRQWFESGYDDSAWAAGFAELGAGDAVSPPGTVPEKTVIGIGPAVKFSAIYFRKTFTSASAQSALTVSSLHDDGSVVYLNGTIVAVFNMTNVPPFAYADLAPATLADDGTAYYRSNIAASVVAGVNTLAVEIHQQSTGSSDISFDLMLWSNATGPHLNIIEEGANVRITWTGGGTLQYTDNMTDAPAWTVQATGQVSPGNYLIPHNQSHRFYSLRP